VSQASIIWLQGQAERRYRRHVWPEGSTVLTLSKMKGIGAAGVALLRLPLLTASFKDVS
jgi:hypothetical protein